MGLVTRPSPIGSACRHGASFGKKARCCARELQSRHAGHLLVGAVDAAVIRPSRWGLQLVRRGYRRAAPLFLSCAPCCSRPTIQRQAERLSLSTIMRLKCRLRPFAKRHAVFRDGGSFMARLASQSSSCTCHWPLPSAPWGSSARRDTESDDAEPLNARGWLQDGLSNWISLPNVPTP